MSSPTGFFSESLLLLAQDSSLRVNCTAYFRITRLTRDYLERPVGRMHVKKMVSLVEARAMLSGLTKAVANGDGAIAITQRSKLAAVLVNAEQYEAYMAELEHYRSHHRKKTRLPFSSLMEISGDLEGGSERLAGEYHAALKLSGDILSDALRD